jgi:hypothetical protein
VTHAVSGVPGAGTGAGATEQSAPERQVARDLVRRGLIVAPLLILACGALWGVAGAASSAYAIVLVLANFLLAAGLITWSARISLGVLMGAVLFGYLLRLGLIFLAVYVVKDAGWVERVPLGFTIIVTHLGLLVWELRYVSATLAYPGLKPAPASTN